MTAVGLICTTQVDLGLRMISAQLQRAGIETRCFFLDSIDPEYPEHLLRELGRQLRGVALVGVSLVEMGKSRAQSVSRYIRRELGIPVIWGGTYPTLAPEEAAAEADFVCYGEGDETMPRLVDALVHGRSIDDVPNLAYYPGEHAARRRSLLDGSSGRLVKTPAAPLVRDLDPLPFPDYFTPGRHFDIDENGRLRTMSSGFPRMERSTLRFRRNLWMMFGRGCHLRCTYCSVPALWDAASGLGRFFRFKSPERMIEEIEWALERTGGADYVYIMDNDFCAMPLDRLRRFSELYRERIRLPFFCYGTPVTIRPDKARALVHAGVERLDFGIQSGSDRVLATYKRRAKKADILAAAEAIALAIREGEAERQATGYPRWPLKPYFDVIFNAPFEEAEDLQETLDVIKKIGRMGFEFGLYCQPLTFFRNTGLHTQARAGDLGEIDLGAERFYAGLSYQQIAEHIIGRGRHLYLNTIIYLLRYDHTQAMAGVIPRRVLEALTRDDVVAYFESVDAETWFRWLMKWLCLTAPTRDRRYFIKRRARARINELVERIGRGAVGAVRTGAT